MEVPHRPHSPTAYRFVQGSLVTLLPRLIGAAAPGGDDENAPGALPDALLGSWKWQEIGNVVCDPVTGQCGSSFDRSQTLELTEEGRFTHVLVYESHLGGCCISTQVQDSCGESGTTDESGETDRYSWEVAEGEDGVQELTLVDEEENRLGPFQRE